MTRNSNTVQKRASVTLFSSLLCWQHITLDSYIPCLTDLCKALWEVMLSYHRTMQWHEEHDKQETTPIPGKRQLLIPMTFWNFSEPIYIQQHYCICSDLPKGSNKAHSSLQKHHILVQLKTTPHTQHIPQTEHMTCTPSILHKLIFGTSNSPSFLSF